jgi:phage protein D
MRRREAGLPVNQPQVQVIVDGVPVPGVVALEIESLGYFSADRFLIVFAIGAGAQTPLAFFAGLGRQTITIGLALGGAGLVTMLIGQIDNIRIDLLENTATLSGRDLSAQLIDSEIAETFANQTSSQIAMTIAARRGLSPNVTATQVQVGQYYELDHARNALGAGARATTEWNLLTWLALTENFALSVSGSVLNFGPPAVPVPVFYRVQDFISLSLDTATTLPTMATVKSWNSRNKTVNAAAAGTGGGLATTVIRPNLTAAQAATMAVNHLTILGQHAMILTGTMPGDLVLTPTSQILLSGTESVLDRAYAVEAVTRSLDARTGFTQSVRAYAVAA